MTDLIKVGSIERPTQKIELKDLKGAWVIVYVKLNVGETRQLRKEIKSDDGYENTLHYTAKAIKQWNLSNDGETPLPVNVDNLEHLSEDDLTLIAAASRGMTVEELKEAASDRQKKS